MISDSEALASHCAAFSPVLVSIRISSGPSNRKENPRCASSICGEETLNRQPLTLSGEAAGKWLEPGRETGSRRMTVTGATRATKSGLSMDFVPLIQQVPELRYSGSGIFYVRTQLNVSYRNDLK